MHRMLLAGTALGLSLAIAQPASAQSESSQPAAAGLDVITVTAQRREESLQDAAIAINAASGESLIQSGVTDATQLGRIAPALTVAAGGGPGVGYFVRGVGNVVNNGFTNPAIAFNIDGVYIGRSSSSLASFLDLDRVEVLKGPQGTLYGRNSTGGAINVIPNRPEYGFLEGNVSAQYGNYDALELTGAINLPVGDDVAMRIAAGWTRRDGWFSDGTGSIDDVALRAQVRARLGDAVDVRLAFDYSTQGGTGPGINVEGVYRFTPFSPTATITNYTFIAAPANVTAPFTGLHAPQTLAFIRANGSAAPLFSPLEGYGYPYRDDNFMGLTGEINVDLGNVDLVVIPAWRRSELDTLFNGPPFKAAINQDVARQYSLEARFSGSAGPVDWIVGGYWFDERVQGVNSFNQFATVTYNDFDYSSESLAAFARATFNLTDDLRLVGGIRFTDESRSFDALTVATTGVCLVPSTGPRSCPLVPTVPVGLTLADSFSQLNPALFPAGSPVTRPSPFGTFPYVPVGQNPPYALIINTPTVIDRTAGDEEVTWRAAVEYDATPDNLLYASFETGFRAGGFNTTFGQEEYAPEFIEALTIGSKNRFFDNRLQLNLEAFYWWYEGQQLGALGVDANGNNSFFTRNVGSSTVKGVELDFQALVTDSTRLFGGVQWLDATYDSFTYNQVDTSAATDPPNFLVPITGCSFTQITTPRRSFNVDCSGKPALYSPEWSFSIGVDQTIATRIGEFNAVLEGRYRGDRFLNFNYLESGRSGEDFTMDASLGFRPDNSGVSIRAFVRNLTNETIRATYQVGAGGVVSGAYEPPRTYGLRIGYEF